MLRNRRLRTQMHIGIAVLFLFVALLSWTSFQSSRKFRQLTKNIRERLIELPLAAKLNIEVSALRASLTHCHGVEGPTAAAQPNLNQLAARFQFRGSHLRQVEVALQNYIDQLETNKGIDPRLADVSQELSLVEQFKSSLRVVSKIVSSPEWDLGNSNACQQLDAEVEALQTLSANLPSVLKQRMEAFANESRVEYQRSLYFAGFFTLGGCAMMAYLAWSFSNSLFWPLVTLLRGARAVANGNYAVRIELPRAGEMEELAEAFNAMTSNFLNIQQELNRQVQQRTKQVVRSEQMASVGFLAAGVAHEINNPLASIAWSAESLEMRLLEILNPDQPRTDAQREAEIASMKKYLRRIQDEAFRCKGITNNLLDFSRLGDAQKVSVELSQVVESVIEMVRPLGRYRHRHLEFQQQHPVHVVINPQELKQVVLNLITNALDAVDEGGRVWVSLEQQGTWAVLKVRDDGCGMTEEVRQHLFEPFFTRRRDGQGTGLGLSITYRIIEEHGGQIEAASDGPNRGSQFIVSLPLYQPEPHAETTSRIAA